VFVVTVLCKRLKTSNISFLTALFIASLEVSISRNLAQTTNNGTLGSFSSRIPTSLLLLHTTYTRAFKPGCLMSHNWLHYHHPHGKVLNEIRLRGHCINTSGPEAMACMAHFLDGHKLNQTPHAEGLRSQVAIVARCRR